MSAEPPPSPFATRDDAELLESGREAALEAAVQKLRLVHELKGWRGDPGVAVPAAAPGAPREASSAQDFVFDVARLQVNTYRQLLALTSRHFDGLMQALRGGTRAAAPGEPRRRLHLEVAGALDGEAVQQFDLQNPFPHAVEVGFGSLELRDESGGGPFLPKVVFYREFAQGRARIALTPTDPQRLDPGRKARFSIGIQLVKPFEKERRYRGEVVVLAAGQGLGVIEVELWVS